VDPNLAVSNVETMEDVVARATLQRRETLYLIGGFAALALVLAVIGLYGTIASSVAQRTAEMGIRQAVGAQRMDILKMILGQGLRLTAIGVVLGAAAAAGLTRLMKGLLFKVGATDPATFLAITGIFLIVGLAASFAPAWRATRIDPVDALSGR
jgi:ABC-type antimicrobial peptide transport system permease subunit